MIRNRQPDPTPKRRRGVGLALVGLFAWGSACATEDPGSGGDETPVPAVVGLPESDAHFQIQAVGLTPVNNFLSAAELALRYGADSASWPEPGTVVRTSPEVGTRMALRSEVELFLADWEGFFVIPPDPVPPDTVITMPTTVPDVVGMSIERARNEVASAGLRVRVVLVPSASADGIVVAQSVQPGQAVNVESELALDVGYLASLDADSDGVADARDRCPETPSGVGADSIGCSTQQRIALERIERDSATYAFNAPDTLLAETPRTIAVVLTPDGMLQGDAVAPVEAVRAILTEFGETQRDDSVVSKRGFYARLMRVELGVPDGWSKQAFQSTEPILIDGRKEWSWEVVPPRCPRRRLWGACEQRMTVSAYASLEGGGEDPMPLFEETIVLQVTAGQVLSAFWDKNWKFLIGTLLIPLVGAWWRVGKVSKTKTRILHLAANGRNFNRLALDEERRAIDDAIQKAPYRDQFEIEEHGAVRADEVDDFLLRHRPHIVHFSGHGSKDGKLIFAAEPTADDGILDAGGQPETGVAPEVLGSLFGALKGQIRCVVLNACYSAKQAEAIAEHIDVVVGVRREIHDDSARDFAAAFYHALASGESARVAYEVASSEIERTAGVGGTKPVLVAKRRDPATVVFSCPKTRARPFFRKR